MSKSIRTRRLPWENQSIIPSRRKALRQPILRKNDFNNWLSEYQRKYQNPRPPTTRESVTPSWVPFYEAQLQLKAGARGGGSGWEVGAGDGPEGAATATATGNRAQRIGSQRNLCSISRRSCYQSESYQDYQSKESSTTATATGKGQSTPETSGFGSPNGAASMEAASNSSSQWGIYTGNSRTDSNQQNRAQRDQKRDRSDSGLTNLSIALCLWRKNDPACQAAFALLPWQQQVAQTTLEARMFSPQGNTSRRIY
ncbi:hypothetical protein ElyMa_003932600 [Elysia marginata]|uniref:Uncharacterized protein n=1 Tax=Elysia marginata TaxID=1093978 RepID=A0AAV4FSR9_9GAST|nr:hypothetical protein ElyMa_003932600 [Elysia marginata]